jgi:hypothetical protein
MVMDRTNRISRCHVIKYLSPLNLTTSCQGQGMDSLRTAIRLRKRVDAEQNASTMKSHLARELRGFFFSVSEHRVCPFQSITGHTHDTHQKKKIFKQKGKKITEFFFLKCPSIKFQS